MRVQILEMLRCPQCAGRLALEDAHPVGERIESGSLLCASRAHRYPIRNFIPRFVRASNYADNFGLQWNKFRQTQLDSYSGHPISAERFWKATGWTPLQLAGQWVLDVGCGAGRFAEIALQAGAKVVAVDYSSAIDACYANLNQHPDLHAIQGDIYALPFMKGSFPYVYSLGVLQHTPSVAAAFAALPPMVAEGGRLSVDIYENSWRSKLLPKHWLRPITRRVPHQRLFATLQIWVPRLFSVSCGLGHIPVVGPALRYLVPVANYTGKLPLTKQQQLEWSLLDTFDWYAPAYDNPQTARTMAMWCRQAGMQKIEVTKAGQLVARGIVVHATGR
jgi:2-polyprenyl-3-methyl-5-hydroxy-6-metoxy-1,4-benzoquinol methylase